MRNRVVPQRWVINCYICDSRYWPKNTNEAAAVREAERKGWRMVREKGTVCPECVALAEFVKAERGGES